MVLTAGSLVRCQSFLRARLVAISRWMSGVSGSLVVCWIREYEHFLIAAWMAVVILLTSLSISSKAILLINLVDVWRVSSNFFQLVLILAAGGRDVMGESLMVITIGL